MATVPAAATNRPGLPAECHWFKGLRYVGVAAAIIIAASAVVVHLTLPSGPSRIVADVNDDPGRLDLIDHNRPLSRDMNVYDNNAVP